MQGHSGGSGGSGPSAGKVKAELESMRDFKKRVDRLIDDLDESDATPDRIDKDRISQASLGTGFGEAEGLYSAYNDVHDQLTSLSRLLSGQVEALSAAVEGSRAGYEAIDQDVRDRMWATQGELEKHYDAKHDPYAKEHASQHDQAQHESGDGGSEQKKGAKEGSL